MDGLITCKYEIQNCRVTQKQAGIPAEAAGVKKLWKQGSVSVVLKSNCDHPKM